MLDNNLSVVELWAFSRLTLLTLVGVALWSDFVLQVYVFIGREHASKVVLERDYLKQIQVGKGLHNPLQ